jgi:hypothetical protein
MVRAKASGWYVNSILANQEATADGYDEALLLDVDGYVSEGSGENFFLVNNGKLYTPDLSSCLDGITRDFSKSKNRKSDEFRVLKKGLSYCWSVAVAASPDDGKRAMEKWFASDDADVRAVMRENLKKERLKRMDAAWAREWETKLS